MENKGIFALNEDSVAEYVVAIDKEHAIKYSESLWGKSVTEQYYKEYKNDNPTSTYDEFLEDFIRKMPDDEEFSLWDDSQGKTIVKTIGEFLKNIEEVPSCFACSGY